MVQPPPRRTAAAPPAGLPSGGQRQQLAIARALLTSPRILILDEPTEGIQPSVVTEIQDANPRADRRGGLSVLPVEQHVGFALAAATTDYVMPSGRVAGTGEGGAASTDTVRCGHGHLTGQRVRRSGDLPAAGGT